MIQCVTMKEDAGSGGDSTLKVLSNTTSICRDFLRNVCNRDKRCKFKHLSVEELNTPVNTKDDPLSCNVSYEFCHDFQNKGCERPNCKFIHCSSETELIYKESSLLPLKIKYEYELGIEVANKPAGSASELKTVVPMVIQHQEKPVCRDYTKRQCKRGKKCRFVHLDQNSNLHNIEEKNCQETASDNRMHLMTDNNPEKKRIRLISQDHEASIFAMTSRNNMTKNMDSCLMSTLANPSFQYIKEENFILRKELNHLRKQVSDLSATNEVLLEQNAQFRLQKRCLAESQSFSQANNFATQSPLSVSVPIAMSLSVPGQTQQLSTNGSLSGASLLASEPMTVTPVDLINSNQTQQPLNTANVGVITHPSVPAQACIQMSRSIPQNTSIVNNLVSNNSQLLDDLHSMSNRAANVGQNPPAIHANIAPVLQQTNHVGQTVASFSITQNTIPISQNLICSMPSMTTSSATGTILSNQHPSILTGNCSIASPITMPTHNQSQGTQNIATASGLVVQANRTITVEGDADPLNHMNRSMATAQMAHATLVTNNQQNPSSARQGASTFSASLAAVAAQVMTQGSLAQPNPDMGNTQISVPAVPCRSLASAIVPVTITTSLPMGSIMPSLSLENSPGGLLATHMGSQPHCTRVMTMVTSCPASAVSMARTPGYQAVNSISGRHVVGTQQQINTPINFTINPVASVTQQPGPGMHA